MNNQFVVPQFSFTHRIRGQMKAEREAEQAAEHAAVEVEGGVPAVISERLRQAKGKVDNHVQVLQKAWLGGWGQSFFFLFLRRRFMFFSDLNRKCLFSLANLAGSQSWRVSDMHWFWRWGGGQFPIPQNTEVYNRTFP